MIQRDYLPSQISVWCSLLQFTASCSSVMLVIPHISLNSQDCCENAYACLCVPAADRTPKRLSWSKRDLTEPVSPPSN